MKNKKSGFILTVELILIFTILIILIPLIILWIRLNLSNHHDHAHNHPHGYSQHHHHNHEDPGHDETVNHSSTKPHHHSFAAPVAAAVSAKATSTANQVLNVPETILSTTVRSSENLEE